MEANEQYVICHVIQICEWNPEEWPRDKMFKTVIIILVSMVVIRVLLKIRTKCIQIITNRTSVLSFTKQLFFSCNHVMPMSKRLLLPIVLKMGKSKITLISNHWGAFWKKTSKGVDNTLNLNSRPYAISTREKHRKTTTLNSTSKHYYVEKTTVRFLKRPAFPFVMKIHYHGMPFESPKKRPVQLDIHCNAC